VSTFISGDLDRATAQYLLTMQDACIRGMANHWPHASWIKFRPDGSAITVMVWMNKACAEQFYPDPYAVIGHCDRAAFSDERAAQYAATDQRAIDQAGTILNCSDPGARGGRVSVRKLAYRIDNEKQQGWAIYGECIDDE